MPQPTLSDVHVNAPLSNLSMMYAQDMDNFVADKVFPIVPVQFKSNLYYIFDRSDFNRDQMQKRAPATESAGGGYKLGTGSYTADVWALHKDIDDQIRANSDPGLNPDANATRFLTTQALISKEVAWASSFFTTSVWTTQYSGVAAGPVAGTSVLQWNDVNSNPIQDIRNAMTAAALVSGGFRPNTLVLGRLVFDALLDHPDFLVRINAGQTPGGPAKVTRAILASMFEVDNVYVMDAIYNTGPDSNLALNSGESNAFIGGAKSVLAIYVAPNPSLDTPGAGYNFSWTGYYGANGFGARISNFRMEWLKATRVEIEQAYAYKVTGANMGVFFSTIVA